MSLEESVLLETSPKDSFQWVAIYDNNGQQAELYQYTLKNGVEVQTKISEVKALENNKTLRKLYLIPKDTLFSENVIPRIGVDYVNGVFDVNGTIYDNKPPGVVFDTYRFVFYRTIHTALGFTTSLPKPVIKDNGTVKWYKIGWQSTVNGMNYQRVIWYDPSANTFTLREKR